MTVTGVTVGVDVPLGAGVAALCLTPRPCKCCDRVAVDVIPHAAAGQNAPNSFGRL